MSVATMSTPVVPPRPARSQDKATGSPPTVPATRPAKRFNRSVSPNPDRFAPSPLNENPFNPKAKRLSQSFLGEELERSTSVELPSIGQEGQEYAAVGDFASPQEQQDPASPEQTRSVGEDVKLHAPKPTVAPINAKQRVQAVTRTDSDKAASFGIGRPSSEEPHHIGGRSLKKKASTTSQLSHHSETHGDDEHGIPEIGQRVPMLAYAGDVQAPSPAPPRAPSVDSTKSGRHHTRRTSSRAGFHDAPPGSYGLHGHGFESTDKLEKAYYEKHPDARQKEHWNHLRERDHDYSMSSDDLNKIVQGTSNRGAGLGIGTPTEMTGYRASEEYASRIATPQPSSQKVKSSLSDEFDASDVIHIDDNVNEAFNQAGNEQMGNDEEIDYPILASDAAVNQSSRGPAVPPHHERRASGSEEPRSRPSSRPTSIYSPPPADMHSTPLDDVEEYEPLFPEGEGEKPKTRADILKEHRQRFPSRDIWEDAPNSVHTTAEVSTPEPTDRPKSRDVSQRNTETPAQAFARKQEELAEKEAVNPDSFLNRTQRPKSWAEHQSHVVKDLARPPPQRFPSRDVWEDTPDSLQFTTTVSHPQTPANETSEDAGSSPTTTNKPVVPTRPLRKQGSGDDGTSRPIVPARPKPQIPARPSKLASATGSDESESAPRPKPAVPARPVGGKIAALQGGFLSALNSTLLKGPQAPKKETPETEEAPEEKQKAPLSDARKARARGPQRRAPTKSSSPSAADKSTPPPASGNGGLSFSTTRTLWSIDEEGTMTVDHFGTEKSQPESTVEEVKPELTSDEVKTDDVVVEETQPDVEDKQPPDESLESDERTGETKTIATNTAGESILQETLEKKEDGDGVAKVDSVDDAVVT